MYAVTFYIFLSVIMGQTYASRCMKYLKSQESEPPQNDSSDKNHNLTPNVSQQSFAKKPTTFLSYPQSRLETQDEEPLDLLSTNRQESEEQRPHYHDHSTTYNALPDMRSQSKIFESLLFEQQREVREQQKIVKLVAERKLVPNDRQQRNNLNFERRAQHATLEKEQNSPKKKPSPNKKLGLRVTENSPSKSKRNSTNVCGQISILQLAYEDYVQYSKSSYDNWRQSQSPDPLEPDLLGSLRSSDSPTKKFNESPRRYGEGPKKYGDSPTKPKKIILNKLISGPPVSILKKTSSLQGQNSSDYSQERLLDSSLNKRVRFADQKKR